MHNIVIYAMIENAFKMTSLIVVYLLLLCEKSLTHLIHIQGTLPQMKSTVIVPLQSTGPVNISGTSPGNNVDYVSILNVQFL